MAVYDDIWAGPGRNVKRVNGQPVSTFKWYITIHATANDATARQEANYAKVRTDGTGSHYYTDKIEILQSTDTDWCVGHVGSSQGNSRGLSYEITGVNAWTRDQWLANVAWDRLAAVIARDCKVFGIPVRLLSIDQMRAFNSSNKGFVTHNMCRQAWGGTTHTDPGPNFPMDHLLNMVNIHLNGGTVSEIVQLDALRNAQISNTEHYLQSIIALTPKALGISNTVQHDLEVVNELSKALKDIQTKVGAITVTMTAADQQAIAEKTAALLKPELEAIVRSIFADAGSKTDDGSGS